MEGKLFLGLDVGSVSVNTVLMDEGMNILEDHYTRTKGQPIQTVVNVLKGTSSHIPMERVAKVAVTGSGGELVADLLGGEFVNEVIAQSRSVRKLYPGVKTVIEMGGEDSKLLILDPDGSSETTSLKDFSMNDLCAAGTGSFLDQQASRLGLTIEEFGRLALESERPPRIAGRCSVFAKSDMIHLQQIGTLDYDIVAGLCFAVARCFKGTVGRGKRFERPMAFQGGVAANAGMVRAFEDVLGLERGELIVPEHYASMGAIGAVLVAKNSPVESNFQGLGAIEDYQRSKKVMVSEGLEALSLDYEHENERVAMIAPTIGVKDTDRIDAYVGVDVGSLSTNVVVIDKDKNVIARRYLRTAGRPLEAVKRGLLEVGREIRDKVQVLGVGTTGSGRYLTGDFVGADTVKNEITAQAAAAIDIDPAVDTVFEIGGQDSKYISIDNGTIVDFEMNKVCAAGTGSFLEEQAERLNISIVEEFGNLALEAENPGKFGDRCTVFMTSDLMYHQQQGLPKTDLVAGLAYSIVYNYLNKVVGDRRIGDNIFFQGGVAWNKGVVAAFERVLGKKITVPPHHDVTGAIGVAILAMNTSDDSGSNFRGFDLSKRKYMVSSFECRGCENVCEVMKVKFDDEKPLFYGTRCERFEVNKKKHERAKDLPDLFGEREKLLLAPYRKKGESPEETTVDRGRKKVGILRVLYNYEMLPYWNAFFTELGFEVVLTEATNPKLIHRSVEALVAESCFPVNVVHGHVLSLIEAGVDYLFLPSIINLKRTNPKFEQNYNCPYVQAVPYTIRSAIDVEAQGVKLLQPSLYFQRGKRHIEKALVELGKSLGKSAREVKAAMVAAEEHQQRFYQNLRARGEEILSGLDRYERPVVIISRPYNGCDPGLNLDLPKKLRDLGALAIPMDFLPLESIDIYDEFPNMYWRYGQRILSAIQLVKNDERLNAVFISNFRCGPDSFILHFVREQMGQKPYLQLEVDEHSADAGVITRCEAFFDSLENAKKRPVGEVRRVHPAVRKDRVIYLPLMSDHAYAISAAFRACGVPADVLPESDEETLEWGRKFTSGKECFPFITTTGDILKKAHSPDFDPKRTAFFMPTANGPCRFGQYQRMQRIILDELGYAEVPIVSPSSKDSYSEFGMVGDEFRCLAWKGVVATDVLQKLVYETRPYEVNPGETEQAYRECLQLIVRAIEDKNRDIMEVMEEIKRVFQAIRIDRSERRPIIGVVGEIYLRSNRFSNNHVVDKIEQLGGEAWVAPISEWFFYVNQRFKEERLAKRNYTQFFKGAIKDWVQRRYEHRLAEPFKDMLLNFEEPRTEELLENSKPYMRSSFGGEAILSVGKSIDYIKKGLCGIVNVMPFTCMPGTVVTAISKRLREDHDNIPWLNLAYDGQGEANARTRLEAFMYQARQYQERLTKGRFGMPIF